MSPGSRNKHRHGAGRGDERETDTSEQTVDSRSIVRAAVASKSLQMAIFRAI
jgi:hypothetical protein